MVLFAAAAAPAKPVTSRVCAPACDHTHRRSLLYLPLAVSFRANSRITVRRIDMLLTPTAWRRKFFVRGWPGCGPPWPGRHKNSPGDELGCPWVGLNDRGLRLNCSASSHACLTGPPSMPAHISAVVHACRLAEIALRRRRCPCRSAWAAPRAKGFSLHGLLLKGATRRHVSTHGPKGPRRRLRRRVPGNTGRRAGGARCARAQEPVQVGARGGPRLARWGVGGA